MNVQHLEWDSSFFGYQVYRILDAKLDWKNLKYILCQLKEKKVKLVYWDSESEFLEADQLNGILVDIKTKYSKVIRPSEFDSKYIRSYNIQEDKSLLLSLAFQSGEYSRFKIDPNFTNGEFELLYTEWIKKSILRTISDEVFIYELENKILGFVTIKIIEDSAIIGLIAVDKESRGRKIGETLLKAAEQFALNKGCEILVVTTQRANKIASNFYEKNKFKIINSTWTYHFWFPYEH